MFATKRKECCSATPLCRLKNVWISGFFAAREMNFTNTTVGEVAQANVKAIICNGRDTKTPFPMLKTLLLATTDAFGPGTASPKMDMKEQVTNNNNTIRQL